MDAGTASSPVIGEDGNANGTTLDETATATPTLENTVGNRPIAIEQLQASGEPSAETPARTDTTSDDAQRCVICLDAIAEPCVAQPCGHRHFDFLCLVSWLLQRQPSCPLCKATVATVQYSFTADSKSWKTFPVPAPETKREKQPASQEEATTTSLPSQSTVRGNSSRYANSNNNSNRRSHRDRDRAPRQSAEESLAVALERRRRVYRLGLYSLHVGANRHSRYYRELTPQLFAQDPDLVSRARAFVRRELSVLLPGGPPPGTSQLQSSRTPSGPSSRASSNAEFLLEYIIAILKTIDMQASSGQAEELLHEFLGRDNTRLFLHELRSWLRSPYLTLASWDRNVQYGRPTYSADRWQDDEGRRAPGQEKARWHEGQEEDARHNRRPRGSHWRPGPKRLPGRGDDRGLLGRPASGTATPPYRVRRNEEALQEACRRYHPS